MGHSRMWLIARWMTDYNGTSYPAVIQQSHEAAVLGGWWWWGQMGSPFHRVSVWEGEGLRQKKNVSCVSPQRGFPWRRWGEGVTDRGYGPIQVKMGYAQGPWVAKSSREEGEWQESGRLQWMGKHLYSWLKSEHSSPLLCFVLICFFSLPSNHLGSKLAIMEAKIHNSMKERMGGTVPTMLPQLLQGSGKGGHERVPWVCPGEAGILLGPQRMGAGAGSRYRALFWKLRVEKEGEIKRWFMDS